MAMNPRTHPRGAPPDFSMAGLPPVPKYTTPALWWLVQMRLRLEPKSKNGGTFANKRQYHNTGNNLLNHRDENGNHDWANDPSIRRTPDKTGPWWLEFCAAHDWTFDGAHTGDYTEIKKYCNRLRNAMRDPKDLRPDEVYAYFIGQIDNDRVVEGYNEYEDDEESGDITHLWHRHDSFRRNIIGLFSAMWKALTIDMGWTYAEYLKSVTPKGWDEMATKAEVEAAAKAGALAALQTKVPYALSRIDDRGWADLSINGKIDYLFEQLAAAQPTDVDGDNDLDSNSLQARLTRLETAIGDIKALLTPPPA
jgi:hypothetical protein